MSVWRTQIDISFPTEDAMKAMLNLIEKKRSELVEQGGGLPIPCQARYHNCMHQEGQPCGGYVTVKFDGVTDHGVPAEDAVPAEVKTAIKAPVVAEKEALQAELAELKKSKPTGATGMEIGK